MSEPMQFWTGEGGDAYTQRNRVNWLARVPFWTEILTKTGVASVLEVGCNFGANLLALRTVRPSLALYGVDVNDSALAQAGALDLNVSLGRVEDWPHRPQFGLVFTAGVLIHIPPADLERTLRAIVDYSTKYVLAIEYEAAQEEEIPYRGQRGLLWRRSYGRLYEDLGLTEVESGYLGDADGFDANGVTWWLMRKP